MNYPLLGRLRSGYLYIALLFVICFALGACHEQRQDSGRVAVTTTIAPAASLIQAIGGELVSVTTLLPKGNMNPLLGIYSPCRRVGATSISVIWASSEAGSIVFDPYSPSYPSCGWMPLYRVPTTDTSMMASYMIPTTGLALGD